MSHLSPQTLTHDEQKAVLRATRRDLRDHLIYSLALGTGLRLAEIVGLNVGEVYSPDGRPKNRLRLRREIAKNGRAGDVFLPDALVVKFRRFLRHKATRREGLRPEEPLFCSQTRSRTSPRRVQFAFRTWQVKAGLTGCIPSTVCATRPCRKSTGDPGTSSWRRGSRGTCRHSPRRSTRTPPTRRSGREFAGCRAEPPNR